MSSAVSGSTFRPSTWNRCGVMIRAGIDVVKPPARIPGTHSGDTIPISVFAWHSGDTGIPGTPYRSRSSPGFWQHDGCHRPLPGGVAMGMAESQLLGRPHYQALMGEARPLHVGRQQRPAWWHSLTSWTGERLGRMRITSRR